MTADPKGVRKSFGAFLKDKSIIDKHIVSLSYGDLKNSVTFGGYQQFLLSPLDQNTSLVWHPLAQNQDFGYLPTSSKVKLSSSLFTKSSATYLLLSNTSPDLRLYTTLPSVYYDFDDQLTKIFPTVICKEDTQLLNLKCYLDFQECKDVKPRDANITIEIEK